jgi:hypothetical protein
MKNKAGEHLRSPRNTKNTLLGLLIGSLAGAVIMLLLAPRSGRQTQSRLDQKNILMGDRMLPKPISVVPGIGKLPIMPVWIRPSSLVHFTWLPPFIARPAGDLPLLGRRQGNQKNMDLPGQSSPLVKRVDQLLSDDRLENDSLGG